MMNKDISQNSILKYILWTIVIVLCVGYILISFNNRYQNDDLGFGYGIRVYGVWGRFIMNAHIWETNLNTLVLFTFLQWIDLFQPFVFNIFIFFVDIFGLWILLKTIIKYYSINTDRLGIFLISTLIMSITYFSCRAEGNVTYWVTGQIVYCLVLFYLFIGLHFWIKGNLFLASVFLFFFAHSRLNYDAIFIGLYVCFYGFKYFKTKGQSINWKSHLPFLIFVLGIITYILIPGNFKRAASIGLDKREQQLSIFSILNDWLHAFKHLVGIVLTSWKQLVIFPIGLLLGLSIKDYSRYMQLINIRCLLLCTIAFVISYIGQSTVMLLAIGTPVGYGRVFFFLEMILFILLLLYGSYAGIRLRELFNERIIKILSVIITVFILVPISYNYYRNIVIAREFSEAYDKRITYLLKEKADGRTNILYVKPLPLSGTLQFMEILPQIDGLSKLPYDNWVYVEYYDLPFNIYLNK